MCAISSLTSTFAISSLDEFLYVYFVMDVCLLLLCFFSFSVLNQEIGWEERLRNDLFCVGWGGTNSLNSINQISCATNDFMNK